MILKAVLLSFSETSLTSYPFKKTMDIDMVAWSINLKEKKKILKAFIKK